MARVLCIDFGTARTGIAVTDPLQIAVHGLETVRTADLKEFLVEYLRREEVQTLVVGVPRRPGKLFQKKLHTLIDSLEQTFPDLGIEYHEEDMTSREAQKIIRRVQGTMRKKSWNKGQIDRVSAVLILQDFLGHLNDNL